MTTCPLCQRDADGPITGICTGCEARISQQLSEIVNYAHAAQGMSAPQRTGESTHSAAYGSRPPINLAAVDYADRLGYATSVTYSDGSVHAFDRNGLAMLHEWERIVREERQLTPPALVPYSGNQHTEIGNVCRFLVAHLSWAAEQPWADELGREVAEIHRAGMIALRAIPARRGRIACPGDDPETGDICAATIWLPDDLHDYVRQAGETQPKRTLYCSECGTTWTVDRLFQVAKAIHGVTGLARQYGRDVVAHVLQVSPRHVNRMIAKEAG